MSRGAFLRLTEQLWRERQARSTRWQRGAEVVSTTTFPRGDRAYTLVTMCRFARLPEPIPEYKFHPERAWRFDYAWPQHLLALEVEGGIWRKGGGAHSHPMNIVRDCEKYSEAAVLGWRILRVPPEKLRTDGMRYLFAVFDLTKAARTE